MLCEEHISFKQKLKGYLETQSHLLAKSAVDIRLNTDVTPEYAKQLRPDVIIAAIGARPVKPPVKGIELENVCVCGGCLLSSRIKPVKSW